MKLAQKLREMSKQFIIGQYNGYDIMNTLGCYSARDRRWDNPTGCGTGFKTLEELHGELDKLPYQKTELDLLIDRIFEVLEYDSQYSKKTGKIHEEDALDQGYTIDHGASGSFFAYKGARFYPDTASPCYTTTESKLIGLILKSDQGHRLCPL